MLRDKAIHPNVEGIWGQANCGAKCHPRAIRGQALAQTRARDEHTTLRLTAQASNWGIVPVPNCRFARSLELVRSTPVGQQDCKVGRVNHAVVIEIGGASSALAP
jgi:hypothetical protein